MSTTLTTPQWAIEAAKEMLVCVGNGPFAKSDWDYASAILAKHAPPLSPPTDEGKLREKVLAGLDYCMDWKNQKPDAVKFACAMADARQYIIDHPALAPHLSQREPSDTALLEFAEKHTSEIHSRIGSPQGSVVAVGIAPDRRFYRGNTLRAALKAAMKGEVRS